jgi:aspartate dehydrogenase
VVIGKDIADLLPHLPELGLVVECSHPSVVHAYGLDILKHTDLFVSSPTAFSKPGFYESVLEVLQDSAQRCYVPVGASVGLWDVIRLDQNGQLKNIHVTMKKHPLSFRITEPQAVAKLEEAQEQDGEVDILSAHVGAVNAIAPQNTNTMSIYAMASPSLGFTNCQGTIIADRKLEAHIVECEVETTLGLKLHFTRYNPAKKDAVTGSATFSSFLNSLLYYKKGIAHRGVVFC